MRLVTLVLAGAVLAACSRASSPGRQRIGGQATIARPLEVYKELGFMAGPQDFPGVASFSTLDGPGDSTYVLFALSLPNSALRFTRDDSGFGAEYSVAITFLRDSVMVKRLDRRETVRIAGFSETGRVDESIIFQDLIAVAPGKYTVTLQVSDTRSARGMRSRDSLTVPAFGAARRLAAPVVVYASAGRNGPDARPDFIVNPRKTVPYGADVPHVYVELYSAQAPETLQLRAIDDRGTTVWQSHSLITVGDSRLRHTLIDIPLESLPLGRLWVEASTAGGSPETSRIPLLVTISDQWMVANFDDVLRFVNYIATPAELDSLRTSTGAERRQLWDSFWKRRDPLQATVLNEYREEFFQRVRFATDHFSEAGRPGWDTDRGEVYIVLGPPDQTFDRRIGSETGSEPNAMEWHYDNAPGGRLQLLFLDRTGFGRFDLSPQSENDFKNAAQRMRPRRSL